MPDGDLDPVLLAQQGRAIIRWGWAANVVFAVSAIPVAVGVDDALGVAIGVALVLFLVATVAFVYAFAVGLARSGQGDNVAVANLFFLQGSAPKPIKQAFLWMFLVCLAITVGHRGVGAVRGARADVAGRAGRGVGGALRRLPAASVHHASPSRVTSEGA